MAFLSALCAVVRSDIARAEPASCARQTDGLAIALFRVDLHLLVEHVSLEHLVASVAVPSFIVSLAVDAVFCFLGEGPNIFDLAARRAAVARCARWSPVFCCLSCAFPL